MKRFYFNINRRLTQLFSDNRPGSRRTSTRDWWAIL